MGCLYIKSAIKSFELQDYQDKELIIIYSKSNDGTEEFLNKFILIFHTVTKNH